jgi:2,3-dihydro-2,3-dihydroxybenzoate dehydrogenase
VNRTPLSENSLTPFSGQLAIVSGAASGIGRSIALSLASQGATVAALDSNRAGLASLLDEAHSLMLPVHTRECDVSARESVEHTVTEICAAHGAPHCLVNVAGILRAGTASQISLADWEDTFRVNTTGVMLLSQAVVRQMIPLKRGAIVTVASNAGHTPRSAICAYAASKAAAAMYTKCLGLEVAGHNIRCNVVSPGSTDTPMLSRLNSETDALQTAIDGNANHFRIGIPLRRVAQVNDVCDAVLFLLSSHAKHITLHELTIDGGATLGS